MIGLDGNNLAELTDARSVDVQPAWSPDGKVIVFASNRAKADLRGSKKSQWDIWMVSNEGKNLKQITFDAARDGAPSVAANGDVYFHSDRKVSQSLKAEHQVKSNVAGFHIWKISP